MIRKYILFPLFLVGALWWGWRALVGNYPDQIKGISWTARQSLHSVWFEKELHFDGLNILRPEDLEVNLPLDKSILWWQLNRALVTSSLSSNPLVASGEVTRCSRWSVRCYNVKIQERRARFIAEVQGQEWVLSEDGSFLAPVPPKRRGDMPRGVVFLKGLGTVATSPDALRAQLKVVQESLRTLEGGTDKTVSAINLKGADEFEARFAGSPFGVTFDLPKSQTEFKDSVVKLNRVLSEFKGREDLIRSIDLAYHKMAVVTLEQ